MALSMRLGLLAVIVGSSLAACGNAAQAPAVRQVVSTTSFGMCAGYCATRLEISEGQAILTRTNHGGRGGKGLPDQQFRAVLEANEWQEIERLANTTKLDGLPAVIGCPDCADGGAESLTIVRPDGAQTISFDYGADIAQAQPLLERVRALRARMTPKP